MTKLLPSPRCRCEAERAPSAPVNRRVPGQWYGGDIATIRKCLRCGDEFSRWRHSGSCTVVLLLAHARIPPALHAEAASGRSHERSNGGAGNEAAQIFKCDLCGSLDRKNGLGVRVG